MRRELQLQTVSLKLRMLLDMKSSSVAYVVFATEAAKSAAVDAVAWVAHGGLLKRDSYPFRCAFVLVRSVFEGLCRRSPPQVKRSGLLINSSTCTLSKVGCPSCRDSNRFEQAAESCEGERRAGGVALGGLAAMWASSRGKGCAVHSRGQHGGHARSAEGDSGLQRGRKKLSPGLRRVAFKFHVLCKYDAGRGGTPARNLFQGTMLVSGACLLWTLLLYLPYAFYMASFTYANGDEPGGILH